MENEKRGISQITGKTEIKLGEKAFYKVSRIHRKEDHDKVRNALWKIYVNEKGNWRELKSAPSVPPKKGDEVSYTITNQALAGKELLVEAYIYEPEKKAPPGLKIKVVAGIEKKIQRVELFMSDDTPIKEDTILKYNQTIKVKVYTQNMPNELLKLTLYEDDADKGGHNPKNEKNKVAYKEKQTNENGFLWHEFKLNAEFSKIANAMMDGSSDKLHEYYVLVESTQHGRKTSKNIEAKNPDYTVHQTYENGKITDHKNDKIYEGGVIEEVIIKGKYKKQIGIDPIPKTGRSVSIVSEPPEKKEEKVCDCKKYDLIWGDKVSCEFRKKVVEICADLWGEDRKINMANGLMAVINVETSATFKAHQIMGKSLQDVNSITKDDFWLIRKDKQGKVISKTSRAIGLIQFTQAALEQIGEFKSGSGFDKLHEVKLRFAKMGEVTQLDHVKKYFEPSKEKIKSPEDIYLHVFAPKGVGKDDNYVLYDKNVDGEKYTQNKSVDNENNADGKIQRFEILGRYRSSFAGGLSHKESIYVCNNEIKQEPSKNSKCPEDYSQCFDYSDVVANPRINNQSNNVNKNRFHRARRVNKTYPKGYYHTGTDILASLNTPLKSMLCGEVTEAYNTGGDLGIIVTVKSKDKDGKFIWIRYCHLNSVSVKKEQKIKHGTLIGFSGNTGNAKSVLSQYYHVHIEASTDGVFKGGNTRVDPEKFMKTKFDETIKGNPIK